ncbi:hypothetical protein MCNS_09200 [Mycobacterium conspicuum]|uniref:Uncharacterized protein n=1 Tax=Mycobacterium conspicuum TaxID=44010 RepID=A0A7I7Y8B6_9MYCO|nr:hypothetical protein MCNS_09200 [Mycobacterium conspicuum]
MTAKVSRLSRVFNVHSPTASMKRQPAGEWQTSGVRVIIAHTGAARTRPAGGSPGRYGRGDGPTTNRRRIDKEDKAVW